MNNVLANFSSISSAYFQQISKQIGQERAVFLVTLAALLLLSSGLAKWTWQLVVPPTSQVIVTPGHDTPSRQASLNLQGLMSAQLFGKAEAEAKSSSPLNVPLSSLNLVLAGVVAAGESSIAIISVSGQEETPFSLGEEITHGALLHAVYSDRVILQRGGILESLVLEDLNKSLPGTAYRPASNHSRRQEIRSLGNNNFVVPRAMLSQQLKNPDFLRDAHIVANKGGGFRVRRLKSGSLYSKLGLKRGDIIKSVNGVQINTMQDAMNQYQQLESLSQVQLEIVRKGKSQMLQFHLQ